MIYVTNIVNSNHQPVGCGNVLPVLINAFSTLVTKNIKCTFDQDYSFTNKPWYNLFAFKQTQI